MNDVCTRAENIKRIRQLNQRNSSLDSVKSISKLLPK